MSFGCGEVKRTRRIPSTAPAARSRSANSGRTRAPGVTAAPRRQLEVAAVAVDVLTEQRDLGDPAGGERLDLGDDLGERARDLDATHGRHDAERAVVVAADLDRHPRVVRRLAHGREGRREQGVVVDHGGVEDLRDRSARRRRREQLGRPVHVVRAHHDVDVTGAAAHLVTVLLRQATGHDDLSTVALRLPRLQVAEVAVQLVVRVLADAARVQHHDVGVVEIVRGDEAVGLEEPGDALGVVLVHLAPEGAHEVAPLVHGPRGYRSPQLGCRGWFGWGGPRHCSRWGSRWPRWSSSCSSRPATACRSPPRDPVAGTSDFVTRRPSSLPLTTVAPAAEQFDRRQEPGDSALSVMAQTVVILIGALSLLVVGRALLRMARSSFEPLDLGPVEQWPEPAQEMADAVDEGLAALASGPVDDVVIDCWVRLEVGRRRGRRGTRPSPRRRPSWRAACSRTCTPRATPSTTCSSATAGRATRTTPSTSTTGRWPCAPCGGSATPSPERQREAHDRRGGRRRRRARRGRDDAHRPRRVVAPRRVRAHRRRRQRAPRSWPSGGCWRRSPVRRGRRQCCGHGTRRPSIHASARSRRCCAAAPRTSASAAAGRNRCCSTWPSTA